MYNKQVLKPNKMTLKYCIPVKRFLIEFLKFSHFVPQT